MLIFRKQLSRNKTKHWNFKVMIGVSIWICRALDQTTWHAIYLFIATLRALYLSKFQGFATWPSPCCWFWFHLCSSDYQSVKWKVGHRKASLADDLMSLSMIGTLWKVFILTFKWNLVPTTPFFFQVAFQVALTLSCWFLWLMA